MNILGFGLSVALIGLLVVFVGLVILIFCIKGISAIATMKKEKAPDAPKVEIPAPKAVAKPAPAAVETGVSGEVMAAITAAIAAVWQGETGFVVRRVRRINNAPAWNRAGREEQTYSRY